MGVSWNQTPPRHRLWAWCLAVWAGWAVTPQTMDSGYLAFQCSRRDLQQNATVKSPQGSTSLQMRPETPSTRPPTSTTKERRSGWDLTPAVPAPPSPPQKQDFTSLSSICPDLIPMQIESAEDRNLGKRKKTMYGTPLYYYITTMHVLLSYCILLM